MTLPATLLTGLAGPLFELIDDLFTSDKERSEAKRKLLSQEGRRSLQQLEINMSAISRSQKYRPLDEPGPPHISLCHLCDDLGRYTHGFFKCFSTRHSPARRHWYAKLACRHSRSFMGAVRRRLPGLLRVSILGQEKDW